MDTHTQELSGAAVHELVDYYKEHVEDLIATAVDVCGSPIEVQLFIALLKVVEPLRLEGGELHVELQAEIRLKNNRDIRADFLIHRGPDLPMYPMIIVECDGHDFHERTKEQAARDRSRDRAATAAGYVVMRFTGSEIYKDPDKCASEILDLLMHKGRT